VLEAAGRARARTRAGHGPTLLECATYRHYGHSRDDPGTYRPASEVRDWLQRDPLPRLESLLPGDEVARIRAEVESDMAAAKSEAVAAGFAGIESVASEMMGASWST
jgi:acetoin:2,6-dichlorophenolindophenol oxidoreductase subunit alpha